MHTVMVITVSNSSKKYAFYRDKKIQLDIEYRKSISGFERCINKVSNQRLCESIDSDTYDNTLAQVEEIMQSRLSDFDSQKLSSVVLKVAVAGSYFQHHQIVDVQYVAELKKKEDAQPAEVSQLLREIFNIQKYFPDAVLVAASDSAFHRGIPAKARNYSFSKKDADEIDLFRFGFHGLSSASVQEKVAAYVGSNQSKIILCRIGSEVSVVAIQDGMSVDCSTSNSPTTGLVMPGSGGDIDCHTLLELMRAKNLRPAEAKLYLDNKTGLQGMTGESDLRHLLAKKAQGESRSIQALDLFVYQIQKAIAASTVALGGVDAIIMTGTAAHRSAELRYDILNGLKFLGVTISPERNEALVGKNGVLSTRNSPVKAAVIKEDVTQEMYQIATTFLK